MTKQKRTTKTGGVNARKHAPAASASGSDGGFPMAKALSCLRRLVKEWEEPIVTQIQKRKKDPFLVLISTMLSLRTKDATTREASERLFDRAADPQAMLQLSESAISKLIYPVGFYKTKARSVRRVCSILIDSYGGGVPTEMDALLSLPGVGRKTANLVLTHGHGLPGICVDTHVHRISNRWAYVKTGSPDKTELALRKKLPARYWREYNDLLVMFGQNMCLPVSPHCSKCPLRMFCPRCGVKRSR